MPTTPKSRVLWLSTIVVALAFVAAACGSSSDDSSTGDSTSNVTAGSAEGADIDYEALSGTLDGSGATFPKGFYEGPIDEFQSVAPGVTVNYAGGGSGKGKTDLADQVTVTGPAPTASSRTRTCQLQGRRVPLLPDGGCPDHDVLQPRRRRGAEPHAGRRIAKIFRGTITTWNDPAIAADNPGARCRPNDHRRRPRRRVRHDGELHEVPHGCRRCGLDARFG